MPDLRLPSQPQSITAPWPVPNYTAWWQRHMGVNNLPRVAIYTQQWNGRESGTWIQDTYILANMYASVVGDIWSDVTVTCWHFLRRFAVGIVMISVCPRNLLGPLTFKAFKWPYTGRFFSSLQCRPIAAGGASPTSPPPSRLHWLYLALLGVLPSVQTKLDCCNAVSSRPRRLWGVAQRVKSPRVVCSRNHLDNHDRRQSQDNGLSAIRLTTIHAASHCHKSQLHWSAVVTVTTLQLTT